jgi:hypothetical protein
LNAFINSTRFSGGAVMMAAICESIVGVFSAYSGEPPSNAPAIHIATIRHFIVGFLSGPLSVFMGVGIGPFFIFHHATVSLTIR